MPNQPESQAAKCAVTGAEGDSCGDLSGRVVKIQHSSEANASSLVTPPAGVFTLVTASCFLTSTAAFFDVNVKI